MKKFDYKEFNRRYDKFKNNNLPTPFWDRERQVLEYVFFEKDKIHNELNISNNLTDSFANKISLYYPFNCVIGTKDGQRKIGHCHEHSFENVLRNVYDYPVSFSIPKKDEYYYSKQELEYLKVLKNYFLLVGLSDIPDNVRVGRFRNKLVKKYQNSIIITLDNHYINDIIKGKCVFFAVKKNKENKELKKYSKGELQYLVLDKKNNFRLLIEYTEKKKQKYQEIKKYLKINKTKDNDDVMVSYFKVLEIFTK